MKRAFFSLAICALALVSVRANAADSPCITFVLDCSAGMSTPIKNDLHGHRIAPIAPTDSAPVRTAEPERTDEGRVIRSGATDDLPGGAEISKFDAARYALNSELDHLSADGNARVSLWFFGHRLAWEKKDDPGLMEQTAYLEQTLGFDVLKDLLPGDDVEMARPMIRLEPRDLAVVGLRMNVLKPWGECPLFLAMERAIDSHDRHSGTNDRRVIVITCGDDHQGLAKSTGNKQSVLDTLDSTPVAVHIIRLGVEGTRQQESELSQIARASHGSYHRAATAGQLVDLIEAAMSDESTTEVASSKPQPAPVGISSAAMRFGETVPPPGAELKGKVTYYKSPVKNAKITVDIGKSKRETKTDASGQFTLDHVPAGAVTIHVEATVQNKIRTKTTEVTVESGDKPTSVELTLE